MNVYPESTDASAMEPDTTQNSPTFTDTHAHLSMVAANMPTAEFAMLIRHYAEPSNVEEHPPLLVDPGTEPDDLSGRLEVILGALEMCTLDGTGKTENLSYRGLHGTDDTGQKNLNLRGEPSTPEVEMEIRNQRKLKEASAEEKIQPLRTLPATIKLAAGIWPSREPLGNPHAAIACMEAEIAHLSSKGYALSAIGECGLDYFHNEGSPEAQAELFTLQALCASRLALPVIVHSRDAAADTCALIEKILSAISGSAYHPAFLIHCYSYGKEELKQFLELGCWISFAGNLTYPKSHALVEACAAADPKRLLLETDAPYLNPMPHRGKKSIPADIGRTYAHVAQILGLGVENLARMVTRNAYAFFK